MAAFLDENWISQSIYWKSMGFLLFIFLFLQILITNNNSSLVCLSMCNSFRSCAFQTCVATVLNFIIE